MGQQTSIEWTERTWNPTKGCSEVSPGCANCYARRQARRLRAMGQAAYQDVVDDRGHWTGGIVLAGDDTLYAPLARSKPTTWFVDSMSDLFHPHCEQAWRDEVFSVMAACPQHEFQILTKRPEEMLEYVYVVSLLARGCERDQAIFDVWRAMYGDEVNDRLWPLPNVRLGVSIENQATADTRLPELAHIKRLGWKTMVSAEPLLERLDLMRSLNVCPDCGERPGSWADGRWRYEGYVWAHHHGYPIGHVRCDVERAIDWLIVGGESGPGARVCEVGAVKNMVRQCAAFDVPCFVKQLGSKPVWMGEPLKLKSRKGSDPAEWPEALRVREVPA